MRPEHVVSPANRIAAGSVKVLFTDNPPNGDRNSSWSIGEMTYDGRPGALGVRFNGYINDPTDLGYPNGHSRGTWFILPEPLAKVIKPILAVFAAASRPPEDVPLKVICQDLGVDDHDARVALRALAEKGYLPHEPSERWRWRPEEVSIIKSMIAAEMKAASP